MTDNEIIERLNGIFIKVLKDNSIKLSETTSAADIEQWDSLTHPVLIDAVEKEFNVKFKLKELIKMKNIGDLIKILKEKL